VVRHELHAAIGAEWRAVDEHSGMAEIAGVTTRCLKAWSHAARPPERRSQHLKYVACQNISFSLVSRPSLDGANNRGQSTSLRT